MLLPFASLPLVRRQLQGQPAPDDATYRGYSSVFDALCAGIDEDANLGRGSSTLNVASDNAITR
jgi:hypothetical protein